MQMEEKVNILLVDDQPKNLLALSAVLDGLGQNLVSATSGAEALKCLLQEEFAVILLDVQMPVIDGFETAKLIRSRPSLRHTPIIFITAINRDDAYVNKGYSLGAVDYILKPIVPEILLSKVAAFISLFKMTQEVKQQAAQLKAANIELEREITKRQQAEAALRKVNDQLEIKVQERTADLLRSEKRFQIALKNSPIIVFNQDTDLRYTWIYNPAYGFAPEDLIGKLDSQLFSPEDAQKLTAIKRRVLTTGVGVREETFTTVNGEIRYFDLTVEPVFNQAQEIVGITCAAIDITEKKQAEEIRLALEAEKEMRRIQLRFFSMTSHEFRTPLGAILGSAQILESCTKEWPESKKIKNLHRIKASAKHLTQLLDDILTINRAETGKLEHNPRPLELEKFCRQLLEEIRLLLGINNPITFVSQGQDLKVSLDEKLLRYILTNLLSNAVKYSPEGSEVNLTLTYEQEAIKFQIQDQGIGIPLEDQKHLFEVFHRGTNIENIPGTGLGLSVVKNCLDLQGGKISLQSEVGIGTTVTVTIPAAKC